MNGDDLTIAQKNLLYLTPEKYDIGISIVVASVVDTGKQTQLLISERSLENNC